jgi:hypothetical protein
MSNAAHDAPPNGTASRFSYATLLGALAPALIATAVVIFFLTRSHAHAPKPRADGLMLVTLSQKDSTFAPIPASAGGATGEVLYSPAGPALHFRLSAHGLASARRYALEMEVDGTVYTVASYAPSAHGDLSIDTTMARFEEGVCVGRNFDPPRSMAGPHVIKFWLKRDGSPASGTMPGIAPSSPGAQLPCHGNGDGNYDYVLLDNDVANFTGMASASRADSTR